MLTPDLLLYFLKSVIVSRRLLLAGYIPAGTVRVQD